MFFSKVILIIVLVAVATTECSSKGKDHLSESPNASLATKRSVESKLAHDKALKAKFEIILHELHLTPEMIDDECIVKKAHTVWDVIHESENLINAELALLEHFKNDEDRSPSTCSHTDPECQRKMVFLQHAINNLEKQIANAENDYNEQPESCDD